MTKAEKIDRIQSEIAKLEKGIVKVQESASKKKVDAPLSTAMEERFEEYGVMPFAAATLQEDVPQIDSPIGAYTNMMLRAGHFLLVAVVAVAELPILLGRTVVGLSKGCAYKIGNVKIDKANTKLAKMMTRLEEKREILNELIGLDNAERKEKEAGAEEAAELE